MSATAPRPVILVGYSAPMLAHISALLPARSLVIVDRPEVLDAPATQAVAREAMVLRELVGWDYLPDSAADCFYHRYGDLDPGAVIPIAEYAVPFAARLAERCGVPGAGYGAALALRDKRRQRAITAAAGIPNPRSVAVAGPAEVVDFLTEVGGPVVLKPTNRQAAIGTAVLQEPGEVAAAWAECTQPDDHHPGLPVRMLVEQFIAGTEFSVEMLVRGGCREFGAVTRKFLYPGTRPVELGHLHPADIDQALAERLLADTERVVDAVGMDCGFVHCEWIVVGDLPYFVECAGRMAGDGIVELVQTSWDYDVVGSFSAVMRGQSSCEPPPGRASRYAATWTAPPTALGEITSVRGVSVARQVPGVKTLSTRRPGERATPLRSSADRMALVTATGATPEEALANARHAIAQLEFQVR